LVVVSTIEKEISKMSRGINPKNLKLGGEKINKRNKTPRIVDKHIGGLRKNTTLTQLYEMWNRQDQQTQDESGDRLGVLTTGVIDEENQHFIITIRKQSGLEQFL
jgi:hypothetical protein